MYTLKVFKKQSGCPSCVTLDKLTPGIKKKFPELEWEYDVISRDEELYGLPDFVKSFPTSVLYKDGEQVFIHPGYEGLAKKLHEQINA